MDKAKRMGLPAYEAEQNEKIIEQDAPIKTKAASAANLLKKLQNSGAYR